MKQSGNSKLTMLKIVLKIPYEEAHFGIALLSLSLSLLIQYKRTCFSSYLANASTLNLREGKEFGNLKCDYSFFKTVNVIFLSLRSLIFKAVTLQTLIFASSQ